MERKIKLIESFSAGKKQGKNDDSIYVGEYFAAVVDGVSNKSSIKIGEKEIKIADIIAQAINTFDDQKCAEYLTFDKMILWINEYVKRYLISIGKEDMVGKVEATAAIYSKYHNQIWIIGDCRAIYDGKAVLNPLKIDDVYVALRKRIIAGLIEDGYTEEQLLEKDKSNEIIYNPYKLDKYIISSYIKNGLQNYRKELIRETLLECGFTDKEIDRDGLVQEYYNPREIQKRAKNSTKMGIYGYSVLNGEYTEPSNCRIEQLAENVQRIILSSDGLPFDALLTGGIQKAIRARGSRAKKDRLSIKNNPATHSARRYLPKGKGREHEQLPYATDDASAVEIEIETVPERKKEDKQEELER